METFNENESSFCIFCLKTTDQCATTSTSDKNRFFPLIIRHFLSFSALISKENQEWCRNAWKVISEMTINGDDNESSFENVQICSNCEEISRNFSNLYRQMKELEVKVDWEVGKLRDAMESADKVMITRLEKEELETKLISDDSGVTLGEFRNTLNHGCQAYQEMQKMIVEEYPLNERRDNNINLQINPECIPDLLSPISLEEFQIEHTEVLEYPTQMEGRRFHTQIEVDNQRDTFAEELIAEHDDKQNMNVGFPGSTVVKCENNLSAFPLPSFSAAPAHIIQEEDPLQPPNISQFPYICTTSTCSLPFTSRFELFQHNMANHIGKYFSSVQLSEFSNEHFYHFINNLLEGTLDSFDKVDEKYKCPFCSNPFCGREKARNHLVVKHRPILKEKLVEIQKSERGPTKTPEEMEHNISTTNGITDTDTTLKRKRSWAKEESQKSTSKYLKSDFNCTHCSISFSSQSKLFSHDMGNHPENYFISVKLEILSPHQFQNCVTHLLTTTVDKFQIVNSKYQCNFCPQLFCRKGSAKDHIVSKHCLVLKEKLVELQNSSDVKLIMNTSRRGINRRSLGVRSNETNHHVCNICEKEFKIGIFLNRHQYKMHPEIFFEESNLVASSSENNEQFKKIVRYVLEQQIEVPAPSKEDQVKCGICSKILTRLEFVESHLITRHQVFLAEKLVEVQRSGKSLYEIEDELLKIKRAKTIEKRLSKATGSDFRFGKKYDDDPHLCNLCGNGKMFKNGTVLNQHQMICHPEIFFQGEKPMGLQNDGEGGLVFRKYVLFVLERQVDQEFSKITVSTLPEKGGSLTFGAGGRERIVYKCNFCSKTLCNRKVGMKHLILIHQRNMAQILEGSSGKTVEEIELEMMLFGTGSLESNGHES